MFGSKDDQGVNQPEPQSMPADEGGSNSSQGEGGGGGFSFSFQHPPPDPPHSEPVLPPTHTAPIIPNEAPPSSSSCYQPPYLLLPDHLKPENLPTSEKQHKIIVETSRFVRLHGGQVEVLLKVKQAANPSFGFLLHDHPLHPYYQWIVEKDPRMMADIDAAPSLGDNRDSHQHPLSSSTGHVKDAPPPIHVAAAADPTLMAPPPPLMAPPPPLMAPPPPWRPWRQKGEANDLSRSVCVQQDTSHHMPTQNLQPGPAGPSVSTARASPVSSNLKEQSAAETLARADNWSYEDMLREKERDEGRSKGRKSRRRSRSRSRRRRRSTSKSSRDSRSRSRSRDRSRRHRSPSSRSRERPKRSRSTSTERRDERSKKKRRHRRSRGKYNSRERRYT